MFKYCLSLNVLIPLVIHSGRISIGTLSSLHLGVLNFDSPSAFISLGKFSSKNTEMSCIFIKLDFIL